jgi:hypothetical protein
MPQVKVDQVALTHLASDEPRSSPVGHSCRPSGAEIHGSLLHKKR